MEVEIDSVIEGAPTSAELPAVRFATGLGSAIFLGASDFFGESMFGAGWAATVMAGAGGSATGFGAAAGILGVWGTTNFGAGDLATSDLAAGNGATGAFARGGFAVGTAGAETVVDVPAAG